MIKNLANDDSNDENLSVFLRKHAPAAESGGKLLEDKVVLAAKNHPTHLSLIKTKKFRYGIGAFALAAAIFVMLVVKSNNNKAFVDMQAFIFNQQPKISDKDLTQINDFMDDIILANFKQDDGESIF